MLHIVGVNTFRVSQEYKGLYMLDDGELLQVFSKCKELGALVTTLSENGHVIEAVTIGVVHMCVCVRTCVCVCEAAYRNT